jgi:hypothetical protein
MGYQLIETIEVGSGGAAIIEFAGIPQDGVDLQLVVSARDVYAQVIITPFIQFNSLDTNLSSRTLRGTGSSVFSQSATNLASLIGAASGSSATANTFGNFSTYISNYTSAQAKSVSIDAVSENKATEAGQYLVAGLWNSTAAITTVTIKAGGSSFAQYSTASLYKITAD